MVAALQVMLVDDDPLEARILGSHLKGFAIKLSHVTQVPETTALTGRSAPDAILLDHDVLPCRAVADNLAELRERGYGGRIIVYTNLDPMALEGKLAADVACVNKSIATESLIALLDGSASDSAT